MRPPPSTALRGFTGSSIEGYSATARMSPHHPLQRFVAPQGAPPKASAELFTCAPPSPAHRFVAHVEFHRRPQWNFSHASPPR
eukprot:6027656-Pyramimonas_sp.AAC.1